MFDQNYNNIGPTDENAKTLPLYVLKNIVCRYLIIYYGPVIYTANGKNWLHCHQLQQFYLTFCHFQYLFKKLFVSSINFYMNIFVP